MLLKLWPYVSFYTFLGQLTNFIRDRQETIAIIQQNQYNLRPLMVKNPNTTPFISASFFK